MTPTEKRIPATHGASKSKLPSILFPLFAALSLVNGWSQTNGGYSVNIHNREDVRALYNTVYLSSENVPMDSTANVGSCVPGTNSFAFRNATIRRINFYRAMAGIWANVTEDLTRTPDFQKAALICARNTSLSHSPPNTALCYTLGGEAACGQANLALSVTGAAAIDYYVKDAGVPDAGHRRWVLNPPMSVTAVGDMPSGAPFPANAMYVFDSSATQFTNRDGFVSWPPPGFVPSQLVSSIWSFAISNANYSQVSVFVKSNFVSIPAGVQPFQTGIGQDTLVWTNAVPGSPLANDVIYSVDIQNLLIGGVPTNISYAVTLMDPGIVLPPLPPSVVTQSPTSMTNDEKLGTATVVLNGLVNSHGYLAAAHFEYGLTTNYGASGATSVLGNGTNNVSIAAIVSGLASGVLYHCRLVASNSVGATFGSDQMFATPSFFNPGDANGDGIVDHVELDAVLSNYWPHSPWLQMTNTVGLGTSNVQFALPNAGAWLFTVETTTNFTNWQPLGPAYPLYQFFDPAAGSNLPQRFYRLRWP